MLNCDFSKLKGEFISGAGKKLRLCTLPILLEAGMMMEREITKKLEQSRTEALSPTVW